VSPDLDDRDPTGRFLRGLTIGALLGAIIAGSSIWSRARSRRATSDPRSLEPGPTDVPKATDVSEGLVAGQDPTRQG